MIGVQQFFLYLFVSPDTTNRRQYLAELTHTILNIKKWVSDGTSERTVLLIGLRWPEEAKELQQNLSHIGVSSNHAGSSLRQLESLIKKGYSVLCCEISKIPAYIAGAQRLKIDLKVAIDDNILAIISVCVRMCMCAWRRTHISG